MRKDRSNIESYKAAENYEINECICKLYDIKK